MKIMAYLSFTQAYSHPLHHPSDPRNHSSYRGLCSLLQELPSRHTHTNLRHNSCHITRKDPPSRSLRLHSTYIDYYTTFLSAQRTILVPRRRSASLAPPTSDGRRHCSLLFAYTSLKILSIPSAAALAFLSASQWPHDYGV